jgi:toxin ParE1/3/4
MIRPVILRSEAEADVLKTHLDFEQVRAGLGRRFAGQLRSVLERIEANPELHGIVWKDVRATRLKTFRYVVYYIVCEDRVEVIAVLHGARDPATWQSRVGNT